MKFETPIPEGFAHWDIAPSKVAYAIFSGEFNNMIANAYKMTRDKILSDGLMIPCADGYFHAEVYVKENKPQEGGYLSWAICLPAALKRIEKTESPKLPIPVKHV